jgi:hypothetical protein
MVEWLAGNRIRGTSTERTSTSGFNPVSAVSGGWKELARTTLGSTGDIINVTSIPDKRYYMVLMDEQGATINAVLNVGNGSPAMTETYSVRRKVTDNPEHTDATAWEIFNDGIGSNRGMFTVGYISNLASKEKLFIATTVSQETAGANTTPKRVQHVGKWHNTSDVIDYMRLQNWGTGDFSSGAEMVVLGWDEDDTHTDNFWEELASVELSSAGDQIDSGTFTAKKYLWIQFYEKNSGNANVKPRFNNDSGSNYSWRWTENGGSDTASASQNEIGTWIWQSQPAFYNAFVVNNASKEKLLVGECVNRNSAGAGNEVGRAIWTGKWDDTSNQITRVTINNDASGSYDTGSFIKVWGHD